MLCLRYLFHSFACFLVTGAGPEDLARPFFFLPWGRWRLDVGALAHDPSRTTVVTKTLAPIGSSSQYLLDSSCGEGRWCSRGPVRSV